MVHGIWRRLARQQYFKPNDAIAHSIEAHPLIAGIVQRIVTDRLPALNVRCFSGGQYKQKRGRPRKRPTIEASRVAPVVGAGWEGPQLSPEQAAVVELAARGCNIFFTGSAGCGKSTVLHAIVHRLTQQGKTVQVMAPTGRAALAINGMTTWSFAGWSPNSHKLSLDMLKENATKLRSKARRRFRKTDTIIIDEISMVENLHFERLNQVMKVARVKKRFPAAQYPFGGVQVIVTGDFGQLPPVKPFQHCIKCGGETQNQPATGIYTCRRCKTTYHNEDQWAFRSEAWKECDFATGYLEAIHRQNDPAFISLLQKCRLGEPFTPEEIDLLMNHEATTTGAVELYSTREEVRRVNQREFQRLPTHTYSFKCHDTFIWNEDKHPDLKDRGARHPEGYLKCLEEHNFDRQLELKEGMLVALLVNLDLESGLCNGSLGTIVGWEPDVFSFGPDEVPAPPSESSHPHALLRNTQDSAFRSRTPHMWPIVRFHNGTERTIRAECQVNELGDDEPYSLLCRTQIPLAPAWAMSIHRAQGMTLDRVVVDLSRAFAHGQVYVALSRARSLQGLKVLGDPRGLAVGKGGNKEVRQFYKEKFGM